MKYHQYIFLTFFLCLFLSGQAFAQLGALGAPAAPVVVETPKDEFGRDTPKGMIEGFLKAVRSENYKRAAEYLDLTKVSKKARKKRGPILSQDLQKLLDQGGWVESSSKLSDLPEGEQNDGLSPDIDLVGTLKAGKEKVDLIAEKYKDPELGVIWRFSKNTVESIPSLLDKMAIGPVDRILPPSLITNKWSGVPIGHWAALVVLAVTALMMAWVLTSLIISFLRIVWVDTRKNYGAHILDVLVLPVRIYMAVVMFALTARISGVSIVARQHFGLMAEIVGWVSIIWFFWRVIDVFAERSQKKMNRKEKRSFLSAIVFFRRSARFVLAAVAFLIAVDLMGFDATAGMTALGIGGLALAFGAQKTIENFVSSLTLVMEQPIRVGDFCQIGETMGTIKAIGMRSTTIITLDRSLVTLPNGIVAGMKIENFALRDQFRFYHLIGVRYETTPDQLRYLLVKIREVLYAHPRVNNNPARVRLKGFGAYSLDIEVSAFLYAKNYHEFLEVQEDLLLRIMDIIEDGGSGFAFPSQTVYMAKDSGLSGKKVEEAEEKVKKWKKDKNLRIPAFNQAYINELEDTITYPPSESVIANKAKADSSK